MLTKSVTWGAEIDVTTPEVGPLAEAGERRCVHVPLRDKQRGVLAPRPSAEPCGVDGYGGVDGYDSGHCVPPRAVSRAGQATPGYFGWSATSCACVPDDLAAAAPR